MGRDAQLMLSSSRTQRAARFSRNALNPSCPSSDARSRASRCAVTRRASRSGARPTVRHFTNQLLCFALCRRVRPSAVLRAFFPPPDQVTAKAPLVNQADTLGRRPHDRLARQHVAARLTGPIAATTNGEIIAGRIPSRTSRQRETRLERWRWRYRSRRPGPRRHRTRCRSPATTVGFDNPLNVASISPSRSASCRFSDGLAWAAARMARMSAPAQKVRRHQ